MDQNTLVDGGDEGLRRIADAFRTEGFPVRAIYLTNRRSYVTDEARWTIVIVVDPFRDGTDSDFIIAYTDLRRSGKLPYIDSGIRVQAVPADNVEASRTLEYARAVGRQPLVIRDAFWRGLSIEHVLVAEDLDSQAEPA